MNGPGLRNQLSKAASMLPFWKYTLQLAVLGFVLVFIAGAIVDAVFPHARYADLIAGLVVCLVLAFCLAKRHDLPLSGAIAGYLVAGAIWKAADFLFIVAA